MSEDPEISCVVPTFESLELVAACLTSIRSQRGVRIDLVVSDDSRDGRVREFVSASAMGGESVRFVEGPRSGNPVDNWNHGLGEARGAIRVLVHQDEILADPSYLRRAVDAFERPSRTAVIGRTVVSGGSKSSRHALAAAIGRALPGRPWFLPMLNWIGPTAAFVFRGDHRFDPRLVQLADVEFYSRVLKTGDHVVLRGASVASRGYHGDQITARIDPVVLALDELDALAARRPPALGPVAHAAARLATKARRWLR